MHGERIGDDGVGREHEGGHSIDRMQAMKVRLLFFAVLRDIAGADERELILSEGTSARDVWQSLRTEFAKLADYYEPPMTAINEEYAEPNAVLHEGDELAFIPPVAGG
jgi:molybdopterin converting factor subunit 1